MKARSASELSLFLAHRTCTHCGAAVPEKSFKRETEYTTDDDIYLAYDARCPRCGAAQHVELAIPKAWPKLPDLALGGDAPSELFSEGELRALAEQLGTAPADPSALEPDAFFRHNADLAMAIQLVGELRKFPGRETAMQPELERFEQRRADYNARVSEMSAKRTPGTPASTARFNSESLKAHEAWLARGKSGAGRLVIEGGSGGGLRLGNLNINSAKLTRFDLTRANADFADARGAELIDCTCEGTNFLHSRFDGAKLERCHFAGARLGATDWFDARITGGDFRRIDADRSRWNRLVAKGVDFSGAAFGDCVLDGGVFEDCDLRGAKLARITAALDLCTALNFTFRRCDLRGADLSGRRFDGTKLVDCKLEGIVGKPAIEGPYTIERCDLTAAQVHAMWGRPL